MAPNPFLPKRTTPPGKGNARPGTARRGPSDPLDSVPFFALLSPDVRARVKKKLQNRSLGDNKPLFSHGDPSDALYFVQTGRLRVYVQDRFKDEHVLQFVGPGEVLGEAAFMADAPHVTSAQAVEPSRVWRLARPDFDALLGGDQAVMRYLAGVISHRQSQANARVAAESTPEEARPERGYVTAFFSPRGGSGVTTLAVALAVALAEEHPDEVVLLDLEVLFGHTASYLWLTPKGTLATISPNTLGQLDRRGLDFYLTPHESSLRVFSAATNPREGEQVTADHVRAAISILRRFFTHIVIDLPHNFSEVALTALELADRVMVVGTPELATLRDLVEVRRVLTELLGLPESKFRYWMNQSKPYGGVPVADFAAATGVDWNEVQFGGDQPSQAALRGEPLVTTRRNNPVSRSAFTMAEAVGREARELLALGRR